MSKKNKISILAIILIIIAVGIISTLIINNRRDEKLKDKIGQMLIIGFRGTEAPENSYIIKTIKGLNVGGIIIFDKDNPSSGQEQRNISSPEQVKKLISQLKQASATPILISVDAEGGYVNRLKEKYGFKNIPSAQELGETNDTEKTTEQSEALGTELKELGFNMNFAPVVDVNVNPDNPVIGYLERSFSDDPQKVYENASAFIKGMHENGIITAIKHFPGHGSSTNDSHLGIVDVTNTYQDKELVPYEKLIADGYSDMVMTAHIINRNIDPDYPATLSPRFVQDILRDRLGFSGVIISDDMQMGAIVNNYGLEEAAIKAVGAGCDMLIISNNGTTYDEQAPYKITDAIFRAVKSGTISEERIEASYQRIISLKNKYEI